ncbi:MAG TPA: putative quinol monooxygenase [Terracidiphilus sp.]|jgi:quinol monooxygenase YgiN|nr:putative quinol monooxygenase [Terracidiphilus sp.]
MVSFVIRFRFTPEDRAEVAEALRNLTAESRREPGCVSYIPHHVEGDPDTIVIYEQYQDEKALAAHRETAHFKKYGVGGLFQKMKERDLENLVALV